MTEKEADIRLHFDQLGILAAQVEHMAEIAMQEEGPKGFLPQLNANGTALLRGLSALRSEVLQLIAAGTPKEKGK